MNKRVTSLLQQLSLKVLFVAALFIIALFIFAYIAHEAVYEHEDSFDEQVHTYLLAHSTPALISAAEDVTFLGSSLFLMPAYVLLVGVLILFKRKRIAINLAVIALSSFLLMQLLKRVFHRKRPDMPIIKGITSYSFPSGHSLSAFIFCSILAYLVWKINGHIVWKWLLTILLALLAVAVGLSRIVLNVHFATDVIAGFCLGLMWVIISFWIMKKINQRKPVPQ